MHWRRQTMMKLYYEKLDDLVGGVIGAQIGARMGAKLRGEQLRVLLALIVLGVCFKLAFDLMVTPSEPFSFGGLGE